MSVITKIATPVLLAGLFSTARVAAQDACTTVEVTGGFEGTYIQTTQENGGKPVWASIAEDGTISVLAYQDGLDLLRRQLRAPQGADQYRFDQETAGKMHEAFEKDNQEHFGCLTGLWGNIQNPSSDDGISYPLYFTQDCSEHPADIDSSWYYLECSTCLPGSTDDLTITCVEEEVTAEPTQIMTSTAPPTAGNTMAPTSSRAVNMTMAPMMSPTTAPMAVVTPGPTEVARALQPAETEAPTDTVEQALPVGECEIIEVTEGGFIGVYEYAGYYYNSRPVYGNETRGIGWYDLGDTLRRRLAEEGDAESRRRLAFCSDGAWVMVNEPLAAEIQFPLYASLDCADSVVDIETAWLYLLSEDISSASAADPAPVLTCTQTATAVASVVPTTSPTMGTNTPTFAPTSAPTEASRGIPTATPTTTIRTVGPTVAGSSALGVPTPAPTSATDTEGSDSGSRVVGGVAAACAAALLTTAIMGLAL